MSATSTDGAEIYRKAAELVACGPWPFEENDQPSERFSCWAIAAALGKDSFAPGDRKPLLVSGYESFFKPAGNNWTWGAEWDEYEDPAFRDECRVMALLFMAAMVEAGDA